MTHKPHVQMIGVAGMVSNQPEAVVLRAGILKPSSEIAPGYAEAPRVLVEPPLERVVD